MAALTKHTANSVSFQLKHNNREYDPGSEPKNIEIDPSRTHLNYKLQPSGRVPVPANATVSRAEKAYYNARMKELYHMRRKDLVTAAEWCITMPKGLNASAPEIQRRFFKETYRFCCKKYGEENIVQAAVHYDEGVKNKAGEVIAGQPHMHVVFIPVIPVTDTNPKHRQSRYKEKVNAKTLLTKRHLQSWHSEYQGWMDGRFQKDTGMRALVSTGTTAGKNVSVSLLKAETKLQELQKEYARHLKEKDREISVLRDTLASKEKEIEESRKHAAELTHENEALKAGLSKEKEWGHTEPWGSPSGWGNDSPARHEEEKIW